MRLRWVVLAVLVPAIAAAETVIDMHDEAHRAVQEQRCADVSAIGVRMRAYDYHYYLETFVRDPELAPCASALWVPRPAPPPERVRDAPVGDGEQRSANAAVLMSAGVTAGGVGVIFLGHEQGLEIVGATMFLVGPTVGHVYAQRLWNPGLAVRLVSGTTTVIGTGLVLHCIDGGCGGGSHASATLGGYLAIGSLAVDGCAMLYEIADASESVHRFNRAHGSEPQLAISPLRDARGATAPGLAVVGRF